MQESNILKAKLYAPELPWNVWKADELGPAIMNFVRDHEAYFRRWSDIWFENYQFLFGNHQIKWSKRYGFAVDYDFLRKGSNFAMRAHTNIARVVAEALASLMYSNLPSWATDAMDESSIKGKRYAKIVEKLLDAYMERLNMDKELSTAAIMYVVFGQFCSKIDWNFAGGKLMEIPRWQKVKAPRFTDWMAPNQMTGGLLEAPTPAVGSDGVPQQEERWEAVVDQMGRQIIDKFFSGDLQVDMLTPFEYRRQPGSSGMHKTKWVQQFALMDYDEFLDKYDDCPGKTKEFEKIRPVYHDPTIYAFAVRHFMRMQFTAPPSIDDGLRRSDSVLKSQLFKHKVFVVEHYDKPHNKKWPLGRKVIIANGVATHVTTPTYHTNKLDGWHPYVEGQWMSVAPNSISAGPMNDVIRKNRELDVKDSLIATAVRRNMGSQLLIKSGSGLDPQKLSGEPGMSHEVSDVYGVRWLHDEMPIPPVMAQLRGADKDDVYEVAGAGDALRGQPSTGASSGYQEKQREEREQKRLTPARKNFRQAVAGIGEKIVACLKANVVELDQSVMGFMKRAAAGEFTPQDVITFLYNTIDYGVDIRVEEESMEMKSKATKQATIQELAQGALGQRLQMDAGVLDEYLKEFGVEGLRDDSACHRDRSQRENEIFLDMLRLGPNIEGIKRPIVLFEDDDNIHITEHTKMFVQNAEEILGNEQFLMDFLVHMETHRLQQQEKNAQLMPGTALQVPAMMQQASGAQPPNVQMIYNKTIMDQQQAQASAQQQQGGPKKAPNGKAPQAPRLPKGSGAPGGAGPINPQAPSGNTPPAPSAARGGR